MLFPNAAIATTIMFPKSRYPNLLEPRSLFFVTMQNTFGVNADVVKKALKTNDVVKHYHLWILCVCY